jgi:flagellar biosynthesis/type III secretory pathway chaperone
LKHDIEQLQKIATAEATLVGEIAKQVRERLLKLCESKVNVFVTKNEMPEAIKRNKVINECCEAIRTADLTDLTGVK